MSYNELMQKAGKRIIQKVYYFQDGKKIEILKDDIKKAKPFFNASLIGTVMKGLKLELTKEIPNLPIYFENTVKYGADSATKTIGPYYLKEKPEFNANSKTYSHTLYDNFLTTMVDYEPITIEYPTTVLTFFKKLCIECGFTTDIETLPNGSRILDHDIYKDIGFTFRDVFTDIGQATGTLFQANASNIEKCSLGLNETIIDDDILKNKNVSISEHFGPINCIVLSRSAEADSIYKRDETLISWNEFKISDNQLMNDNNRSDYLNELYDALYGIEFDIFDLELMGYGGFNPLEKIKITTGNKIYNSYVFNNEEEYTQGYTESICTEMPEEAKTDYSKSDKTDRRTNNAYAMVDKQLKEITLRVDTVEESDEEQRQLISEIKQFNNNVQIQLSETILSVGTLQGTVKDMNFNFNTQNLTISNSQNINNAKFNNQGMLVYNYEKLKTVLNHRGLGTDDAIIIGSLQAGYTKTQKGIKTNAKNPNFPHLGEKISVIHHLESKIQSLDDLLDRRDN